MKRAKQTLARLVHFSSIYRFQLMLVVSLTLSFIPATQLIAVALLLTTASMALPRQLGDTKIDRFVITCVVFFAFNTAVGAIFWLLKVELTQIALFSIYFLAVGGMVAYYLSRSSEPNIDKSTIKKPTLVNKLLTYTPFIISAIVFLVIAIPLLSKYSTNYIYQFIGYGGDNVSHIELVNITEKFNGYHYGTIQDVGNDFTASHSSYPQGMHLNISILRDLLPDNIDFYKSVKAQLLFFMLVSTTYLSLLAYLFVLLAINLLPKVKRWYSLPLIYAASYGLFFGGLLDFFLNGFHAHIFSLLLLLTQLYIAIWLVGQKATDTTRSISLGVILLLSVGISFSWLFLLPIALAINGLLVLYFDLPRLVQIHHNRRKVFRILKWWLVYILIVAIALIQAYVQLRYSAKSDPINEPGFITPILPSVVVIFFLLVSLAYAYLRVDGKLIERKKVAVLLLFTIISGLFSLYIYIYQVSSTGHVEYYFYKSAYTIIILGTLAAIVLCTAILDKLKLVATPLGIISTGALFYFFASGTSSLQLPPVLNGQLQGVTPELANTFADKINDPSSRIVSIGSCNRAQDFIITRLAGALRNQNTLKRQYVTFDQLSIKRDRAIHSINHYSEAAGSHLLIIDNKGGAYRSLFNDNVKNSADYITLGDNREARSSEACPSELSR